jgi:hypothetical protein
MTVLEILGHLYELGVVVELIGDEVQVAPVSRVPGTLLAEAMAHKSEIVRELKQYFVEEQRLITLLRAEQPWLLDQHDRWQASDSTAASDEEYTQAQNSWWEQDKKLRTIYGFQGCLSGPDDTCPDGFPCLGCSDVTTPSVMAQLALTSATPSDG